MMQKSNFSSPGAAVVPPGWSGKTTLERLLARFDGREMVRLAAVPDVIDISPKALAGWSASGDNWLFPVDLVGGLRQVRLEVLAEFIGGRRWTREELRAFAVAQRQGLDTCPGVAVDVAATAPARRGRGRPRKHPLHEEGGGV